MGIRSFKDEDVEHFFRHGKVPRKKGWSSICKIARRKLDMLHYAKVLRDLKSPPSNHLEALDENLEGFYSIRVNDQWRIVFKWDEEPYDVQIMDYH